VQAVDDFLAGALVGRGGQGNARDVGEQLGQLPQLQVLRPEVVSPLRHAVRFVDGEQGDVQVAQEIEHARLHQALGGQVEHLHLAATNARSQVALLFGAEGGVQRCSGHAQFFQGGDLVVHQRDERRHHHRKARAQQGRHLEAQGLAATGGHQYQGIAATGHALDNGTLATPETVIAEDVLEDALSLFEHKNSKYRRTIQA